MKHVALSYFDSSIASFGVIDRSPFRLFRGVEFNVSVEHLPPGGGGHPTG